MSDLHPQSYASTPADEETDGMRLVARYQALVDRKYLHGLDAAEQEEIEELGRELDALDAPYYQPAIEYLQHRLAQKRQTGD